MKLKKMKKFLTCLMVFTMVFALVTAQASDLSFDGNEEGIETGEDFHESDFPEEGEEPPFEEEEEGGESGEEEEEGEEPEEEEQGEEQVQAQGVSDRMAVMDFLGNRSGSITILNFEALKNAVAEFNDADTDGVFNITGNIEVEDTLYISNSTNTLKITGGGSLTRAVYNKSLIQLDNGAEVVLEDITIDGNKDSYANSGSVMINIADGTLTIDKGALLHNNNSGDNSNVVRVGDSSTLIMNDGIIMGYSTGNTAAVCVHDGRFIMNGGMIGISDIENPIYAICSDSGGDVEINGGVIFNKGNTVNSILGPYDGGNIAIDPDNTIIICFSGQNDGTYEQRSDTDLVIQGAEDALVRWDIVNDEVGIYYKNGTIEGFIPVGKITVNEIPVAYTLNGVEYGWINNAPINLPDSGDELIFLAEEGPASSVMIDVTAPSGSTVTIKGQKDVTYENIKIRVPNPGLTLNLEDLSIQAADSADLANVGLAISIGTSESILNITGDCTITGGGTSAADRNGGNSIHCSSNTGNLKIQGTGTLTAIGGSGINRPGIAVDIGGDLTIDAETKIYSSEGFSGGGGSALSVKGDLKVNEKFLVHGAEGSGGGAISTNGDIYINGETKAIGGSTELTGTSCSMAISSQKNIYVNAPLTVVSGSSKESDGGTGILTEGDVVVSDVLSITAGSGYKGSAGLEVKGNVTINDGAEVTIYGGDAVNNDYNELGAGIRTSGNIEMAGGTVFIKGGDCEETFGGRGIQANGDVNISGGTLTVKGGDGGSFGGHGIFARTGDIQISGGANAEITGGSGLSESGGVGARAFSNFLDEGDWVYTPASITIAKDAGDVSIAGGTSPLYGTRPSVMAGRVYIATGNIGEVAKENETDDDFELKNTLGGEDVYKVTVKTQPAAAVKISSRILSQTVGAYVYNAVSETEGTVTMWLPQGMQTVTAPGYKTTSGRVLTTNDTVITLTEATPEPTPEPTPQPLDTKSERDNKEDKIAYFSVTYHTNGGSKVSGQSVLREGKISCPSNPVKEGYSFTGWYSDEGLTKLYDFDGKIVKNLTLYAGWAEIDSKTEREEEIKAEVTEMGTENPFADVMINDWYYGDILYVYDNGLMVGISGHEFAPHNRLSRGMAAAILWRMAGEPTPMGDNLFGDLTQDWYKDAVNWMAENAIVSGYGNEVFGADDNLTREQFAVMLYRYAGFMDINPGAFGEISEFSDEGEISDYAREALSWAYGTGLIAGRGENTMVPQGTITRAECAAILHRFEVLAK